MQAPSVTHAFEQLLLCWSITCTPSQDRIMHGIVVLHHTVYFNCVQGVDTPCRQCYEMSYIATGSYTHIAKLVEQQEQQRWLTACMTTAEKANAAAAAIAWCPRACDSSNTFWQSSTNSSKINGREDLYLLSNSAARKAKRLCAFKGPCRQRKTIHAYMHANLTSLAADTSPGLNNYCCKSVQDWKQLVLKSSPI